MAVRAGGRVFVGKWKTGTSSVFHALRVRCGDFRNFPDAHQAARQLPPELVGLPLWSCERSPWAWYASLWYHAANNEQAQRAELEQYGRGSMAFRDVLWGWTHLDQLDEHPQGWSVIARMERKSIPDRPPVEFPRGDARGLWTLVGRWMHEDEQGRRVCDLVATERLEEGLAALFGPGPAAPRRNTARQRGAGVVPAPPDDYRDLYGAEMIRWVEQADGERSAALFGWQPLDVVPAGAPAVLWAER